MAEIEVQDTILEGVRKKFGFVPNLLGEMARNPAVLRVYLDGQAALESGVLSPAERQAVQLAVAVYNECGYCRAAHRKLGRMSGVSDADVEAIESGSLPADPVLRAAVGAAWQVLDTRGFLSADDLDALGADGVDRPRLYEIVAYVGLKTISNYVNHIAHTPIDAAFQG